jgi:phosphohistidine phosphatase
MNLILWRHAEAEDTAPDHTDAGRRLTQHGEKQAAKMAAWLSQNLPEDTAILVSPAARTRQTVAPLERKFEIEEKLSTAASMQDYLAVVLQASTKADSVLLVGHQPTLGQLAAYLMCGSKQDWSVKRGATWWLESSVPMPGYSKLKTVLAPSNL